MMNPDSASDFDNDATPHELDDTLEQLRRVLADVKLAEADWRNGQEAVIKRTRSFLSSAPNNGTTESPDRDAMDVSLNDLYSRFAVRFRKVADTAQFEDLPSDYCPPWIVGTWPLYRWGDDIEQYFQTLLRTLAFYDKPTEQLSEIIEETEKRTETIQLMFKDMRGRIASAIDRIENEMAPATTDNDEDR